MKCRLEKPRYTASSSSCKAASGWCGLRNPQYRKGCPCVWAQRPNLLGLWVAAVVADAALRALIAVRSWSAATNFSVMSNIDQRCSSGSAMLGLITAPPSASIGD